MSATEPLSPLDATFLELEEADRHGAHAHRRGAGLRSPAGRRHTHAHAAAPPPRAAPRRAPALSPAALEPHDRRPALAGVGARRALRHRRARHPRRAAQGPAASASCSLGLPTSGRIGSTVRGRCGASCCSRDSPAGAGRSSPRPTTASWTASARSTRARCCSTPSRSPGRGSRATRMHPAQVGGSANALRRLAGMPMAAAEATAGAVRHPRRAAEALDAARALARAADTRGARRRAADEPQRPAQRASPARRHRGAAGGDQGDQAGARRDGQRRHPLARHRRAARAARGARRGSARRGPARDGAGQRP